MINLDVKLAKLDPTGIEIESNGFSMEIENDPEKNITHSTRLFLHLGDCLYKINEKGEIIERIIPKVH